MGEMISSFDGTKLYLNKEIPEKPKAAFKIKTTELNIER